MGIFNGIPDSKAFLDRIVNGFTQVDSLKDYGHASELMRPSGLALAPNYKFLFHVFFTLGDGIPNIVPDDAGLIGALVKSVQLPSYKLNTKEYVQYNRKRLLHNRIEYEPVTVKFHDDSSDTIRSLWYNYYQYYFADPSYEYESGQTPTIAGKTDYNSRDLYNPTRPQQNANWGITGASPSGIIKPAFFKDITIYGLSRGNYMSYTLINPLITSWRHDTYDYTQTAGVMEHEMQIRYEAVKYGAGKINKGGIQVKGFAKESRYDTEPGVLGRGGQAEIDINGQPIAGFGKLTNDLASGNFLSALRTGLQGKDLLDGDNLQNALTGDLTGRAASALSPNKFDFPSESELLGNSSTPSADQPFGDDES